MQRYLNGGQAQMTRRFTSFGSHNSHNESQEGLLHATMSPSHQRLPLSLNGSSSSELKDGKGRRSGAFGAKRAVLIVAAFALALWTVIILIRSSGSDAIRAMAQGRLGVSRTKIPPANRFPLPHTYTGQAHSPESAYNATWGFGKIYALNLARRPDKVDQLTLMSKVSGMSLEFWHPVPGDQLREEGLPPHGDDLSIGIAGCYRGHADIWRKIIDGPEETALVIEDDVDWEVDWRDAISRLVMPFSTLLSSEANDGQLRQPSEADPWSYRDWDTLFLGACTEKVMQAGQHPPDVDLDHLPVVIWNDTTVAHSDAWSRSFTDIFKAYNATIPVWDTPSAERQRLVARSVWPICTGSYAITKRGAARALYKASRRLLPVDVSLGDAVLSGALKSYTVVPSLISQYKVEKTTTETGRTSLNSDLHRIDHPDGKKETLAEALKVDRFYDMEAGYSVDRRVSVRQNLGRLIQNLPSSPDLWP